MRLNPKDFVFDTPVKAVFVIAYKFTPHQISEQGCKTEILVTSFVQENVNRDLERTEVRNVLSLVIPRA